MIDRLLFKKHIVEGESVVLIIHKHWFVGLTFLFWPTVAFASCWTMFSVAPHRVIFYLAMFGSIGSALWWLRSFFDYYLDAWIVTDQAVIDLDWHGWFRRKATRLLFSDVQGVSYEVQGIAATLLRYGTVSIEKISTGSAIVLSHVSHPREVQVSILRSMEEYLLKKNLKNTKHVQEILSSLVTEEMQRRDLGKAQPPPPAPSKRTPFLSRSI